jgi:hypothetical protein
MFDNNFVKFLVDFFATSSNFLIKNKKFKKSYNSYHIVIQYHLEIVVIIPKSILRSI